MKTFILAGLQDGKMQEPDGKCANYERRVAAVVALGVRLFGRQVSLCIPDIHTYI